MQVLSKGQKVCISCATCSFRYIALWRFINVTDEWKGITKNSQYKVTPDLPLTYSKNGGNLGLVLKIKNIACIPILLTKHVKYTYLYLFNKRINKLTIYW